MFEKFKNKYIFIFVIFLGVTFLLFSNTFCNKFVFSDHYLILENYLVRSFSFVSYYFRGYLTPGVKGLLRPVTMMSYNLNYLIHDYQMWGYHAFNIFLQALNVFLLFLIVLKLTGQFGKSFLLAMLFLVHPINNETVNHLMARSDLVVGFFTLLSFFYFVRYLQSVTQNWLWISVLVYILALLSKECAILLLPLFVSYILLFERKKLLLGLRAMFPFIFISLIWIFYITRVVTPNVFHANVHFPQFEYLLPTQFKVFFFYLRLFFFPWGFSYDHGYLWSTHPYDFWFWICWVLLFLLFFIFWKGNKLLKLGILWMIIFYSWKFFIPLEAMAREHHFYLPCMGLIVSMAGLFPSIARRSYPFFVCVLFFLFFLNYRRNFTWRNEFSICQDVIRKYPDSEIANYQLALASFQQGDHLQALKKFEYLLKIAYDPQIIYKSLLGMAHIYFSQKKYNEALNIVERAISLYPQIAPAYEFLLHIALRNPQFNIDSYLTKLPLGLRFYFQGRLFYSRKDYNQAWDYLQKAKSAGLKFWELDFLLGRLSEIKGKFQEAEHFYRKAFQHNPFSPEVCFYLGTLLLQRFDPSGVYFLKRSLRLEPKFAPAYYNLGIYYFNKGDIKRGRRFIHQALKLGYKVNKDFLF